MRYALLIYGRELPPEAITPDMVESYFRFTQEAADKGVLRAVNRLQPSTTATTVCVRDGRTSTFDGPFMETSEQLRGFYVVECSDLDEATAWAARLPGASHGTVEVRPIMEV